MRRCEEISDCEGTGEGEVEGKIFWPCEFEEDCTSQGLDMDTVRYYQQQGELEFEMIRSDIVIETQAKFEILQRYNLSADLTVYNSLGEETEDVIQVYSVQEIDYENMPEMKCRQENMNGDISYATPEFATAHIFLCPLKIPGESDTLSLSLVNTYDGIQEEISTSISIPVHLFEVEDYYPLLSLKNGGGKFTVKMSPSILNYGTSVTKDNENISKLRNLG